MQYRGRLLIFAITDLMDLVRSRLIIPPIKTLLLMVGPGLVRVRVVLQIPELKQGTSSAGAACAYPHLQDPQNHRSNSRALPRRG